MAERLPIEKTWGAMDSLEQPAGGLVEDHA